MVTSRGCIAGSASRNPREAVAPSAGFPGQGSFPPLVSTERTLQVTRAATEALPVASDRETPDAAGLDGASTPYVCDSPPTERPPILARPPPERLPAPALT